MNRVKELRERAGLQQKEVAIAAGVARPTVSEWEHNKKDPSGERLGKLCELFGVSRGVILCYDEIPDNAPVSNSEAAELFAIPQIAMMGREMGKMNDEQRDQMLAIGKALFKEFFNKEPEDK